MGRNPNQIELFPVKHRSLQPKRLRKFERVNPERVYAAAWYQRNRRDGAINQGFSTLEWILCPSDEVFPGPISQRDAEVAASVIQWLGTNCGLGFILHCERKIEELRERHDRDTLIAARERDMKARREREERRRQATRRYDE